jgi:hypothetical protein
MQAAFLRLHLQALERHYRAQHAGARVRTFYREFVDDERAENLRVAVHVCLPGELISEAHARWYAVAPVRHVQFHVRSAAAIHGDVDRRHRGNGRHVECGDRCAVIDPWNPIRVVFKTLPNHRRA